MLSNKMTFSLMSLITILALGLIASPAFALKVTPKLSDDKHDDVSVADGHQVLATTLTVKFAFDQPVQELSDADYRAAFVVVGEAGVDIPDAGTATYNAANTELTVTLEGTVVLDKSATIHMLADQFTSITTGEKNPAASITLNYVKIEPNTGNTEGTTTGANEVPESPKVVSITRAVPVSLPRASSFEEKTVSGPFQVKIVLTEKPNGGLASDKAADRIAALNISGGKITNVAIGVEFARVETAGSEIPPPIEGNYRDDSNPPVLDIDEVPTPTGRDAKYYPFLATIEPDGSKDKVIVSVKDFTDMVRARGEGTTAIRAGKYEYPGDKAATNGREKLEVPVEKAITTAKPGMSVGIPNGTIIPAGGYLVVVRDDGDGANEAEKSSESLIIHPGDRTATDLAGSGRSVVKQSYNVVPVDLKYNLEGFLIRGGTIDLITKTDTSVKISEIMWATDGGKTNRQWIEIHNTGSTQLTTTDYKLMLYTANEALPDMAATDSMIRDRVSTLYKGTNIWSIASKGQSGRSMDIVEGANDIEVVTTSSLVSMQRRMDTAGMYADGTMDTSWTGATLPSSNFADAAGGLFVGSPGTSPINPVADVVPEPESTPADVAMAADIKITEIMVDTGGGRLPQWIELTNVSGVEKSLAGWSIEIENTAADADAIASSISINLSGTLGIGGGEGAGGTMGKALLLVAGTARSSSNLSGSDRVVDISAAVDQKGRYTLLSPMGFLITLLPPQTTGIVQYGDMAGNLDAAEAWDIPMSDGGRSSLIRREMLADGMATMGTAANGWMLASSTSLVSGPATWYGSDEDAGTPGYDGGGPLPVELSHFRPARDKATGAVVITWATQSELNNAGFFIKRSNQRDGQFEVINAAMVAGAGTTSEKQFYTYTDTTAQPNVVYYYQIEDVSLDGNRQTLTNGIRLKGHIGAAGKLTSTWGELKSSNE